MKKQKNLRILVEGAIMVAAAIVLNLIRIPIGSFGGSIDFVMVPIIFFAVRRGLSWGLIAGFIYGTLEFFIFSGGVIIWQSILLDYSLAYMLVGTAGLFKNRTWGLVIGGFLGCLGRFIIHFISGVVLYAEYMPDVFIGLKMPGPVVYSLIYNALYMLPNTVLVVIVGLLLTKPLHRYIVAEDLTK